MKKKIFALVSLLLCAVLLCSCSQPAVQPLPQQEQQDEIPQTETETASAQLCTAVAVEGSTAEFEVVYIYGSDPYEKYLFWCEKEITDFCIVGLAFDSEGWTTDGVRRLEIETLSPGEAVYYNMMVPEGAPAEAVMYNCDGERYMYAISYNGRDGGISLIEIDTLAVGGEILPTTASNQTPPTEAQTATTAAAVEIMAEIYWLNLDTFEIFAKEMTIESDSKWHVWRAVKLENASVIPAECGLIDARIDEEGVLALNLTSSFDEIKNKSTMCERLILSAIANTFIQVYDLTAVQFLVEGEYYRSPNCEAGEKFTYLAV